MSYLLILLALIGAMALIDAKYRLLVFARPLPALVTLLLGTGIFLLWDVIAIDQGIFLHRESSLMTGVMIAHQLPLEEVFFLFFLCYQTMILVNGALAWQSRRRQRSVGTVLGTGASRTGSKNGLTAASAAEPASEKVSETVVEPGQSTTATHERPATQRGGTI